MTKLELLYAQKSEKFGEVCAVAARELGYGELSTLSVGGEPTSPFGRLRL